MIRAIPAPKQIRNDHRGSGEADGYATAEEQSDADGAANRHHGELPLAKAAMKTFDLLPMKAPRSQCSCLAGQSWLATAGASTMRLIFFFRTSDNRLYIVHCVVQVKGDSQSVMPIRGNDSALRKFLH